jgi:hypothetical protein
VVLVEPAELGLAGTSTGVLPVTAAHAAALLAAAVEAPEVLRETRL